MQVATAALRSPVTPIVARATGATMVVNAREVVASTAAAGQFQERVVDALGNGTRIAVSVTGLGAHGVARASFESICSLLAAAAGRVAAAGSRIEVAISAESLAPAAAWLCRKRMLDEGPLYLLAGEMQLAPGHAQPGDERIDRFWAELWRLQHQGLVHAAYARDVESPCPLLSAEPARVVLPDVAIQAPAASAWATMQLDLADFTAADGKVNTVVLQAALERCIDLGEALHDRTEWPTAGMRHDSWLNRRLAVDIVGLGDLVVRWRDDPRSFACLQRLAALIRDVRRVLQRRSRMLAQRRGNLPALHCADPTRALPAGHNRDGWQRRWRAALEQHATRHRNLLVLSPCSLFPRQGCADSGYFDLLPLLEYADACAFRATPRIEGWDINKFRELNQRAWAVLEHRGGRQPIAERV